MMEFLIVGGVILVFVAAISLPYILATLTIPTHGFFLGTVHWAGDYFYYLSQFVQGKESWFTSVDLYTNDFTRATWVGWVNVFLGRLFSLIGIDQVVAYQLSVVIFSASFLYLSFLLIREIFPDTRKRLIAFILFVSSNAFPKIISASGKLTLSYYDYWFNMGLPFNRLVSVPHQLIGRTSLTLVLLLSIWWWRGRRNSMVLLGFITSGFVLASTEPVHWVLVVVTLFTILLADKIFLLRCSLAMYLGSLHNLLVARSRSDLRKFHHAAQSLYQLLPFLLMFLSGFPVAIYLKRLFMYPPYSQLASWEVSQSLHISLLDFVAGNGPVSLLALLGLPIFIRSMTRARFLALIFIFLTIGAFFSPIPSMLSIVNVRFLPPTTTLFLASLATVAIFHFGKRLAFILAAFVILLSLPGTTLQLKDRIKVVTDTGNGFYYVPESVHQTFNYARQIATPSDTFLVIWPFNWSFPGITGRRVFHGHPLLTIDYERKDKEAFRLFDGLMDEEEAREFFTLSKISYLVTYPWTPKIENFPFLSKVYDSGLLSIYKVVNF